MARFLLWDGARFAWREAPGGRSLRWADWAPGGDRVLLVGNGGTALLWEGEAIRPLPVPTGENLRGVAWHPSGASALAVGNAGTLLRFNGEGWERLPFFSPLALRKVAWHPAGRYALVVGNDGLALRVEGDRVEAVGFAHHHLRGIAFHPSGSSALLAGNRGLYKYEEGAPDLQRLHEEPEGDLIAVAWRPGGKEALVAGFRSTGPLSGDREALLYRWDGERLEAACPPVPRQVWVGVAWEPGGRWAWVVSNPGPLPSPGLALRWDGERLEEVFRAGEFRFTGVFSHPGGVRALLLGSPRSAFWTV